jgi:SAM-dependent methyltransferase
MHNPDNNVIRNEITHGAKIAAGDPESFWGWGSPAGKKRVERRARMIMESAKVGTGRLILEVGCGTGLFTEYFARSGACIVAIDLSGDLIAKARQRNLPLDRVRFVEGAFEECSFQAPFDAVIGSSVLHHLNIRAAVGKIYELLKPGGMMSFTEPNMLNPQIMIQKNIPWVKRRMGDSPDETAFFSWEMRSILKKCGFQEITVRPFDWLHPAIPPRFIDSVSSIGERLEKIPIIKAFSGSLHISARRPAEHSFLNDPG